MLGLTGFGLNKIAMHSVKFIIHVGTPKTGSSSFQSILYVNKSQLLKQSIYYPDFVKSKDEPKHQWFSSWLKQEKFAQLDERLNAIVKQAIDCNAESILLSTEGFFNHWSEFSDKAKAFLKRLGIEFEIHFVLVLRHPVDFLVSLYKQTLINHQSLSNPVNGKSMNFGEMLLNPWFYSHLDYVGFIKGIEQIITKGKLIVVKYSYDVIPQMLNKLSIKNLNLSLENKNMSVGTVGYEVIKAINQFNLKKEDKALFVSTLKNRLGSMLAKYDNDSELNVSDYKKIKEAFHAQQAWLSEKYSINFSF